MVKVKVEQFEGPLDLLLQLIEEKQLDITAVSLANVTEQFLAFVRTLENKNPTHLADFLVIAAKLLVIKSKTLLPTLDLGIEEEESAYDLTLQLMTYKKFKEAAKYLSGLEARKKQMWTKDADFEDQITFLPDPEVTKNTLAQSIRKVAEELKEIIRHPKEVIKEVISISDRIKHIQGIIASKLETSLSELVRGSKNKTEVIVTFLALLELTKQKVLVLEQTKSFDDILIRKYEGSIQT